MSKNCRLCKKEIDLEHGAYFRREVIDDQYDDNSKPHLVYTCFECIIFKHGDFA